MKDTVAELQIENNARLYEPVHFIRAHSKENSKSDIQTEVWCCAFEPDVKKTGGFTSLLASCGGNSVCITDVRTASVKYKFNADIGEKFFALAWGVSLSHSANQLLAAGGNGKKIYFISRSDSSVNSTQDLYLAAKGTEGKKRGRKGAIGAAINSLTFHPTQLDILICGFVSNENMILITRFSPTKLSDLKILQRLYCPGDLIQLTVLPTRNMLLCSHNDGLHAWDLTNMKALENNSDGLSVMLPTTPPVIDERKQVVQPDSMVDSVVALAGTSWIACKTLRSGHIILIDTKDMKENNNQLGILSYHFLRWADTYDAYLSIGWEPERKILACGDERGCVWVYKLENLELSSSCKSVTQPTTLLPWPKKLIDPNVEKERKLRIGTYEIYVSQVALHGDYLAAVTRTNLICIWKETGSEQMEVD